LFSWQILNTSTLSSILGFLRTFSSAVAVALPASPSGELLFLLAALDDLLAALSVSLVPFETTAVCNK
jgi:hypothetical protein